MIQQSRQASDETAKKFAQGNPPEPIADGAISRISSSAAKATKTGSLFMKIVTIPLMLAFLTFAPERGLASDWAGLYIGGHVGWGWDKEHSTNTADTSFERAQNVLPGIPVAQTSNLSRDGFIGGVQVGYDWRHENFVFGVLGDVSINLSFGSRDARQYTNSSGMTATLDSQYIWSAIVGGRAGFVTNGWLTYLMGGAAFMAVDQDISLYSPSRFAAPAGHYPYEAADTVRSGWMAGAGLEKILGNGWSAKLEYNYLDFGNRRYVFRPQTEGPAIVRDVETTSHVFKLGVNYRFAGHY